MSLSYPSPRQLEMELGCPGTYLPLSIPDLKAAQLVFCWLLQGFDLSYTTARSRGCWKVVLQSTSKSLNGFFCSKMVEQLDRLG